jgi:hypothetical protein
LKLRRAVREAAECWNIAVAETAEDLDGDRATELSRLHHHIDITGDLTVSDAGNDLAGKAGPVPRDSSNRPGVPVGIADKDADVELSPKDCEWSISVAATIPPSHPQPDAVE